MPAPVTSVMSGSVTGPLVQAESIDSVRTGDTVARDKIINNYAPTAVTSARVRGIPARLAVFTGRSTLLEHVRDSLATGSPAVVQAVHDMAGVGKPASRWSTRTATTATTTSPGGSTPTSPV